ERVETLKDKGSPVRELGTFVNWGRSFGKLESPAAGVVTAFVRVENRWTIVIANDNTVASGSWWPRTPEKIERAQEMALRLRGREVAASVEPRHRRSRAARPSIGLRRCARARRRDGARADPRRGREAAGLGRGVLPARRGSGEAVPGRARDRRRIPERPPHDV